MKVNFVIFMLIFGTAVVANAEAFISRSEPSVTPKLPSSGHNAIDANNVKQDRKAIEDSRKNRQIAFNTEEQISFDDVEGSYEENEDGSDAEGNGFDEEDDDDVARDDDTEEGDETDEGDDTERGDDTEGDDDSEETMEPIELGSCKSTNLLDTLSFKDALFRFSQINF
ncbi:protein bfr2-like isoform X2 [Bradysia coprophila]|uniref:protein bfr2-like isoform X2 n=1 Tax=Bradysia coprophila TaxID=38358 RepID=UPI00187DC149|nr:protein bfr2-like isoform X2 [Bradysia coprophila]